MKGKILAIFLILVLGISNVNAIAGTLTLPTDLKVIEVEAFAGTTSVDKVIVPDGAEEIQSRAFADSSLTEIVIPESVETIADDAFDGCGDVRILTGEEGGNEGYPAVIEGIDFNGATIYIYDYWTGSSERAANPTENQQAKYAYQDWIMDTYNCSIIQIQKGSWSSNAQELMNFCSAPDDTLCLYILPPDYIGTPMAQNLYADWSGADYINLNSGKWNSSTINFMTKAGGVYGVSTGNSEPRQCLFFNKRVLEEADIDWEDIYDMQAAGTWTWEAFEDILQQITRDTDDDGSIDIYGLTGDTSDLYMMGVFSNGGSFFGFNAAGKLEITCNRDAALEGMTWAKRIWADYGYHQPEDGSWDYYKEAYKQGFVGFYMYQTYGGFNDNAEMADMEDDWGCVAFPIGPQGSTYVTITSDNITVIPNVYDAETVSRLALIYDLWTNPTPGYDDKYSWIGNKYSYTDRRAVDETYGMLREPAHCRANAVLYIGSVNDVLGSSLLWKLAGSDPVELVEAATPEWQAKCDAFNG